MNYSSIIKLSIINQLYSSSLSDDEYVEAINKLNTYDVSDISDKIENKILEIVGKDVVDEVEELMNSERYQKYLDAVAEAGKLALPDVDLLVEFFSGNKGVVN